MITDRQISVRNHLITEEVAVVLVFIVCVVITQKIDNVSFLNFNQSFLHGIGRVAVIDSGSRYIAVLVLARKHHNDIDKLSV